MFITPMSPMIQPLPEMQLSIGKKNEEQTQGVKDPTFLDVFSNVVKDAVETDAQKKDDMMNLMLGDVENIEQIEANRVKASIAMDLLVTVKNSVVDAYSEIIKMQI